MNAHIDTGFQPMTEARESQSLLLLEKPLPECLRFDVPEDGDLSLQLVDLSKASFESHIEIHLSKGARLSFSIASLLPKDAKKTYRIDVHHDGSDGFSRVVFAGIDFSSGPFRFLGSSYIPNGVHGCDTRQEGRITNLAEDCHSEVSPALYIKDNDVKASHGAAVGTYDADVLYYLTSRGISLPEAKRLVTFGYLLPIVKKLQDGEAIDIATKTLEELPL